LKEQSETKQKHKQNNQHMPHPQVGRALRDALDVAAGQFMSAIETSGVQHVTVECLQCLQDKDDAACRKWAVRLLEHFFASNKTAK
jgi:hypothetical protein